MRSSSSLSLPISGGVALCALALAACGTTTTFQVGAERTPCYAGEAYATCVNAKEGDGPWSTITVHEIKDFRPEWGKTYALEVKKTILDNPPADSSSVRYELERVISTSTVAPGTTFVARVEPNERALAHIKLGEDKKGGTFDDKKFTCTEELCARFTEGLEQRKMPLLTFAYGEDPTASPLILKAVALE